MSCSRRSVERAAVLPVRPAPEPALRIGTEQRDGAHRLLARAAGGGFLTLDEVEHRSLLVEQAMTRGELDAVTADLPLAGLQDEDRRRRREALARHAFRIHLGSYLAGVLLMLGIWLAVALTTGADYFWPVWPILGWGIGVVGHRRGTPSAAPGAAGGWHGCGQWSRVGG